MARSLRTTPVDEETRMPLPIITQFESYTVDPSDGKTKHHAFHPEKHKLLEGIGGAAVRNCRTQLVPAALHNFGKHNYHTYFRGPPLPETEEDQFAITILACAGFIPRQGIAIDIWSGPKVFELSQEQHDSLRTVSDTGYQYFGHEDKPIRKFFQHYALKRDWSELDKNTIEEFLTGRDLERRKKLGYEILTQAVEMATEGEVQEKYLEAYSSGLLHPRAPSSSREIVERKIRKEERFFTDLTKTLSKKFGFVALKYA